MQGVTSCYMFPQEVCLYVIGEGDDRNQQSNSCCISSGHLNLFMRISFFNYLISRCLIIARCYQKEGLVQFYSNSRLPPSMLRSSTNRVIHNMTWFVSTYIFWCYEFISYVCTIPFGSMECSCHCSNTNHVVLKDIMLTWNW